MNDIQKAQAARILSCYDIPTNDLEKGGVSAMIGETHTWNGKSYKKQANGKWLEISGDNKTKVQHEELAKQHKEYYQTHDSDKPSTQASMNQHSRHKEIANGLSDKEHSDEEVGIRKEDEKEDRAHNKAASEARTKPGQIFNKNPSRESYGRK